MCLCVCVCVCVFFFFPTQGQFIKISLTQHATVKALGYLQLQNFYLTIWLQLEQDLLHSEKAKLTV